MRRGGYQPPGVPHGTHHNQSHNRMGVSRIYQHHLPHHHHPQHHQNLQSFQNQQQPQMVPYGHGHINGPLPSFPSPPLSGNPLNLGSSNQHHQQHYVNVGLGSPQGGGGGSSSVSSIGATGVPLGLLSLSSGNYAVPISRSSLSPVSGGGSSSVPSDMPSVESIVARLDTAARLLHGVPSNSTNVKEIGNEIQILADDLRRVGPLLEQAYPDVLDRVMSSMRDASAQPSLPPSLRLAIFELVELRASKWLLPSDSSNYYRQRRNINEPGEPSGSDNRYNNVVGNSSGVGSTSSMGPRIGPTTVVFPKPEIVFQTDRSPPMGGVSPVLSNSTTSESSNNNANAKSFREEIVIKNSDSGKVMGVRGRRVHVIEAMSDTIISFEKVAPTAKERVLSINGYSQQSINMAKQLIQETIQRNSSPVFDGLMFTPASGGRPESEFSDDLDPHIIAGVKKLGPSSYKGDDTQRYCYTVSLGDDTLRVTGTNLSFVQEAKFVLDDYFAQKYPELFYVHPDVEDEEDTQDFSQVAKYDRTTLLSLSLRKGPPPNFDHLEPEIQSSIVLDKPRNFDPEKFCKDMAAGLPAAEDNEFSSAGSTP